MVNLDKVTDHPCICCGDRRWRAHFPHTVVCGGCGFVRASRIDFTQAEFEEIYSERYFMGQEYLDYVREERIIKAGMKKRLAAIRRNQPSGRMLEIGCAYGFWLDLAAPLYQVSGIDISADAIDHTRKRAPSFDVQAGDFLA